MKPFENGYKGENSQKINGVEFMVIKNGIFKVYVHTNKTNGKMYVGITGQQLKERWKNGTGYKQSPKFYNAIKKYGWSNFQHDIIAGNLTQDEAHNMEKLIIEKLDLQNEKFGYNIKEGGNGGFIPLETRIKIGNANRGRKATETARQHLSEAHKGVKLSPEHAKAIADANRGRPRTEKELAFYKRHGENFKGENHPMYGKHFPDIVRQHMSEGIKKYYKTHKVLPHNEKKVLCVETNIIYDSIEKAAIAVKACRSQISEAAAGTNHHKTAKGYHWKFV